MTNTPGDYKRPSNYRQDHPDIFFVHEEIVDAFGPLKVDYDSQNVLHTYEIPGWLRQDNVPGWPWSPENVEDEKDIVRVKAPNPSDPAPTIYIDLGPPPSNDPVLKPKSSKELSDDSSRDGDDIHINLRTFLHGGVNTVTEASTTRLNRELILQSAARALVNNKLIRRGDIVHTLWLPGSAGLTSWVITDLIADRLFAMNPTALGVASAVFGLSSITNLAELKDTRRERIKAIASPMVEKMISNHDQDFSFPHTGR